MTARVGKCFDSVQGTNCHNTDLGYLYGWCNDRDNYGPLLGSKSGPYEGYCEQWSWSKDKCPPYQCSGIYPTGLANQEAKIPRKWGWCSDKGVNRAMIGTACGPRNDECDNWVWNAKKCPKGCNVSTPLKKRCSGDKCQLVCGNKYNGEKSTCPPKCGKSECKDKCICNGPAKHPWKAYENKQVRIRAKNGDAKDCGFVHGGSDAEGGETTAKFSCEDSSKGDIMLLEKSRDGKYRVQNSDGCALRWSDRKGGNKAVGSEERVAKFNCGSDAGDPLTLEGTPDNAMIYAHIKGKKCGLQWSSVKGKAKGVDDNERLAKFDCYDKADKMVIDMA